jgi:hypothetical protein
VLSFREACLPSGWLIRGDVPLLYSRKLRIGEAEEHSGLTVVS